MQILIEGPFYHVCAVDADNDETLAFLKQAVLQRFGLASAAADSFYFSYGGRSFADSCKVKEMSVIENSSVQLRARVSGGGGDGGATGAESRDCYLQMYLGKKPDKVDPNETRLCKWTTCALSQESLKPPCVIDKLGNIFNKEALVRALLAKSLPAQFSYIRGLKDMVPVHLEPIKGIDADSDDFVTKFHCPITGLEFNGKYKFFALAKCGHVMSFKAVKEVQSNSCLVCHSIFEEADKIPINGTEEEVQELRTRFLDKIKKKPKAQNGIGDDKSKRKFERNSEEFDRVNSCEEENVGGKDNAKVKKFKAVDMAPANATKEVYASIFTSSKKTDFKETFTCRSLPLGRN
eukprot:TRINITY_DN25712_c0_g1_i1.p1 TRINITY_DN25712_c0_g1~~TRINITY_DN25712_c0_g1_i1.p1  ORF type:complete len:349 (+),score=43.62 TRINITY_DN25712_c0_g1_i1:139-1185(+)